MARDFGHPLPEHPDGGWLHNPAHACPRPWTALDVPQVPRPRLHADPAAWAPCAGSCTWGGSLNHAYSPQLSPAALSSTSGSSQTPAAREDSPLRPFTNSSPGHAGPRVPPTQRQCRSGHEEWAGRGSRGAASPPSGGLTHPSIPRWLTKLRAHRLCDFLHACAGPQ